MYKKIVGAVAVFSVALGTLGMGFPLENEQTTDNSVTVMDTVQTTAMLVDNIEVTQEEVKTIQEQGAETISQMADSEAMIQDSITPLVQSVVEANKRKTELTPEEIQLLLRVVSAEARGESLEAQYTVACVVLNRIESEMFPNTLEDVIVQSGQFSCVSNGAVYSAPITDSVVQAVASAMDNNTLDSSILWFRSQRYHSFTSDAFRIGEMFFSTL